jgi:hypothetical protein
MDRTALGADAGCAFALAQAVITPTCHASAPCEARGATAELEVAAFTQTSAHPVLIGPDGCVAWVGDRTFSDSRKR